MKDQSKENQEAMKDAVNSVIEYSRAATNGMVRYDLILASGPLLGSFLKNVPLYDNLF